MHLPKKPSKFGQNANAPETVRNEYVTPETKLLSKRREFYDQKDFFEKEKQNFKE